MRLLLFRKVAPREGREALVMGVVVLMGVATYLWPIELVVIDKWSRSSVMI